MGKCGRTASRKRCASSASTRNRCSTSGQRASTRGDGFTCHATGKWTRTQWGGRAYIVLCLRNAQPPYTRAPEQTIGPDFPAPARAGLGRPARLELSESHTLECLQVARQRDSLRPIWHDTCYRDKDVTATSFQEIFA